MQKNEIIHSIRETARQVMPSGSRGILLGCQARGGGHKVCDRLENRCGYQSIDIYLYRLAKTEFHSFL